MTEKQALKKIALLLGQADEVYQQKFVSGVMKEAFAAGYSVYAFSMYIKYQNNKEREQGDSNIFNLFQPSLFDAVIILSDTIQTPGVEPEIEKRIKEEYSGPVICVDVESPYFNYFWSEGYEAVYRLVSHMIEEHGKKDIAFLTGRAHHRHSVRRVEAYRDAMKDHGLPVSEDRIFYGDFWYTSGNGCADRLLRDRANLPEALVCANEPMAIGAAETFERNGIRIPEDIALAGYGTTSEGQTSPKPLTASYVPAEDYGRFAVISVLAMMRGEKPERPMTEPELFIGESCGCHGGPEKKLHLREQWTTTTSDEGFYSVHNTMMDDLVRSSDLNEFLDNVYENLYHLKSIDRFDLCLNLLWLSPEDMLTREFPKKGYSDRMIHAIRYNRKRPVEGNVGIKKTFPLAEIIPEADENAPKGYLLTPIFAEDTSFGYAVVSFGDRAQSYEEVYRLWITALARGLESLRRKMVIQAMEIKMAGMERQKVPSGVMTEVMLTPEELKEQQEVGHLLDENLFSYHFQPIVTADDGRIYSYEALMRSGTEKRIPPLTILKYADQLGRLAEVERATMINVLTIMDSRPDIFNERKVFINSIPGIQLAPEDYNRVLDLIKPHPDTVVVEMTEQAELTDDSLDRIKEAFHRLGAGLAIDDYGTGYSNISNMLRYMPNVVKIDRSLLSEIQNSPQKQHFVRDIIEFCHANNILALAEGVETTQELRTVIVLGADLIQGYYTARPAAEIIKEIDPGIREEIVRYHQEMLDGSGNDEYMAGRTNRISVNQLLREHKSTIVIGDRNATFRDVTIVGTPGEGQRLHIEILEGYEGRVTLENVTLSHYKKRPCIHMAENSKLTLCLVGANRMIDGGIQVPESSALSIEGDGSLYLRVDDQGGYGIGNLQDRAHGEISFYQDGEIRMDLNGNQIVGIGSGLGGKLNINRGKYDIYINGDECVGVGAINGDSAIVLHDCDMQVDIAAEQGICIGSLRGNASLDAWSSLVKCSIAGKLVSGIGTLRGESANLDLSEASLILSVNADLASSLGALNGKSVTTITNSTFRYNGSGKEVYVFGGRNEDTEASLTNSDTNIELRSELGTISKADEKKIEYVYGRARVQLNESWIRQ